MKPLRLSLQAWGPFVQKQVLDFRPILEEGVFGIYGATGSGKSTIFNALTFALFGKTTHSSSTQLDLRSHHCTSESMATEVELVFEIHTKRYVVRRTWSTQSHKKKAYLFEATGKTLEELRDGFYGKVIAEEKITQVDLKIKELLGYGAEQFKQIVLLPQGKFETFLLADTKERLGVLRDLFDVSLYRALQEQLSKKAKEAEADIKDLRVKEKNLLDHYELSNLEEISKKTTDLSQSCSLLKQKVTTQEITRNKAQDLYKEAELKETRFQKLHTKQIRERELSTHKQHYDHLEKNLKLTPLLRDLKHQEDRIIEQKTSHEKSTSHLKSTQDSHNMAQSQLEKAQQLHAAEKLKEDQREALKEELRDLERYKNTLQEISKLKEGLAEHTKKRDELLQKSQQKTHVLEKLTATHKAAEASLTLFRKSSSHIKEAHNYEKLEQESQTLTTQITNQEQDLKGISQHLETQQQKLQETLKLFSQNYAFSLATTLTSGQPCPVCGSTDHPHIASGSNVEEKTLEEQKKQSEQSVQEAIKNRDQVKDSLTKKQATLDHVHKHQESLSAPQLSSKELKTKLHQQLQNLWTEAKYSTAESSTLLHELSEESLENHQNTLASKLSQERKQEKILTEEISNENLSLKGIETSLKEKSESVPLKHHEDPDISTTEKNKKQLLENLETAWNKAVEQLKSAETTKITTEKDLETAKKAEQDAHQKLHELQSNFADLIENSVLSLEDYHKTKVLLDDEETHRKNLSEFTTEYHMITTTIQELAEELKDQKRPDLEELKKAKLEEQQKLDELQKEHTQEQGRLEKFSKLKREIEELQQQSQEKEKSCAPLRELADLLEGDNHKKLNIETFALQRIFHDVMTSANARLAPMTDHRYQLQSREEPIGRQKQQGLGIEIEDAFTGQSRLPETLSGGETFMVALSLALGLADVVEQLRGKVRLETVFIDEGFGSLDTEQGAGTLEKVLQVLTSHVHDGRTIGLISHVPMVQEVIPFGFYIDKKPGGASTVLTRHQSLDEDQP